MEANGGTDVAFQYYIGVKSRLGTAPVHHGTQVAAEALAHDLHPFELGKADLFVPSQRVLRSQDQHQLLLQHLLPLNARFNQRIGGQREVQLPVLESIANLLRGS